MRGYCQPTETAPASAFSFLIVNDTGFAANTGTERA
jgi:hypothetical protein